MKTLRIGAGAGYSGDRIDPAVELAEHGDIGYLCFECLAERTIALAQQRRQLDPAGGYDPLLQARFAAVLPVARANGVRILTNMGAANPVAAAHMVAQIAWSLGLTGLRIAAVTGDDVLALVTAGDYRIVETGQPVTSLGASLISANAYLGAQPMVRALEQGADVVITGRVSDPALFLAPLIHEFGWAQDDWVRLGRGTLVGHLLECAGQVTGGYFADPGHRDVPDLERLGFPIAVVDEQGNAQITKVAGTGGLVSAATVKQQLLYEVHDPVRYLQPDVTADFSQVRVAEDGFDRVAISGAGGTARPPTLKVTLGCNDGFIGEGQISYAGPGALARGQLALDIVRYRLARTPALFLDLRFDLIGANAIHGAVISQPSEPYEVRVRVAGRTTTMAAAMTIGHEVEALYLNGPAGGGGATSAARPVVAALSTLVPAELVATDILYLQT